MGKDRTGDNFDTIAKKSCLPFELLVKVCSVIQDTGFIGNAEEYIKQFYGKDFSELTTCEAEMIVRNLADKPGCLFEAKEGGYLEKEGGKKWLKG